MALYDSDPGVSGSWYRGKGDYVTASDSIVAGGEESLSYSSAENDTLGLLVWNRAGQTVQSNWTLYMDSTAPTGSIYINADATSTASVNVTLALQATDADTGVDEMRFSNDGSTWSAWEPYGTSKAWSLTSGAGEKTVYVQFRNNAGQLSISYSDTILLITAPPTVNGFWPITAAPLQSVHVFGTGFVASDATDVQFNGIYAFGSYVVDSTHLVALVPFGDTVGPITVTTPNGSAVSSTNFGVDPGTLTVNGFWPPSGSPLQFINVFGTGFVPGQTDVQFNGVYAFGLYVADSTRLVAIVPSGATTGPITVTTPAGSVSSAVDFTVLP
jgi:hypothetical protein